LSSVYESVAEVISTRFGIDVGRVRPESSFDDLDLDSLSQIELATALKKRLGVEIADDEMAEMALVSDVVAVLEQKGVRV
jgi:acyl carrier protein